MAAAKVIVLFCLYSYASSSSDSFTEELLIKPLYGEQVYTHFHFATKWNTDPSTEDFRHTRLFPRALGEIIALHNVQELHLSLTAGLWRHESWGYPVVSAAPGAELRAWFKPDTVDVDKNWKELAQSLSGLICASLNFIDSTNSIRPEFSFRPSGVVQQPGVNSTFLRYSSLPREVVCTENLTPWKKLLPCNAKSGLAHLLNSGYIHNTRYHSLGLRLRPVCGDGDCESQSLELVQTVSLVYDYNVLGNRDWSLRRLFGQGILGACPLAESSTIYVDVTSNVTVPFTLSPAPDDYVVSIRGGHVSTFAKYKIPSTMLNVHAAHVEDRKFYVKSPPPLYANQYMTGFGQERGGIVLKLYNKYWTHLDVVVLQNFPWYVPVYYHTLKIICDGSELKPVAKKIIPGKQRIRPYFLELLLRLPPRSATSVSVEFEYVFLKWTEYPPDASHGFYIGSAVVSALLPLARNFTGLPQDGATIADSFNASRSGYLIELRTETMVITLPTPDFSMPYNVICLACTVVALAFGPLHNLTTKRLVLKVIKEEKLVTKVKRLLFKSAKSKSESETEKDAPKGKQD